MSKITIQPERYTIDEIYDGLMTIDRERFPANFQALKDELAARQKGHFQCPKCDFTGYEVSEIRASGGDLPSIFDIENARFVAVSCFDCGFTEFYKRDSSKAVMLLDFMFG